jgi:DNA repair protein RAD7
VKKKRKMTKAQEAKAKAAAKKAAKKQKGGNDDDDSDDDDPYNALSKALRTPGVPKPAPGTFSDCAKCGKQFTVVST